MIWDSVYLLLLLGYSENDRDADVITGKGLFQVTLNIDISENGVLVRGLTLRAILKLQKAIKNKGHLCDTTSQNVVKNRGQALVKKPWSPI